MYQVLIIVTFLFLNTSCVNSFPLSNPFKKPSNPAENSVLVGINNSYGGNKKPWTTKIPQNPENKPDPAKIKNENIKLTLTVEIPPAVFEYEKGLSLGGGGMFSLQTPLESYNYLSEGKVSLPSSCAKIQYTLQSVYNPNSVCFYLYFATSREKQ